MPAGSPIPDTPAVGLATKLGVVVGALATLLAAVAPVLDGDQTPETLGGLAVAGLAFYAVIRGRSDQAAAITVAKGAAVAAEVQSNPMLAPIGAQTGPAEGMVYRVRSDDGMRWSYPLPDASATGVHDVLALRDEQALEDIADEETADLPPTTAIRPDVGDGAAAEPAPASADGPNVGSD